MSLYIDVLFVATLSKINGKLVDTSSLRKEGYSISVITVVKAARLVAS